MLRGAREGESLYRLISGEIELPPTREGEQPHRLIEQEIELQRTQTNLLTSFVNVLLDRRFALPDEAYDSSNDWDVIRQPGSILPRVMWRVIFWTLYAWLIFHVQNSYNYRVQLGSASKFFYTFTSFFVVFRLSSAYKRYCKALGVVQGIVDSIRNIVASSVSYMDQKTPAIDPGDTARGNQSKVDAIRFALVYGFTVKLQSRLRHASCVGYVSLQDRQLVEFDLMRARGLLYADEYATVRKLVPVEEWTEFTTGCCGWTEIRYNHTDAEKRCGKQCGLANWALQQLRYAAALFTVSDHGSVERVLNILNEEIGVLQKHSTKIGQSAAIPVPLDYMQMTKFLIMLFQVLFPLQIPPEAGIFTNLFFPAVLAVIFYGMDLMCTDMEDPYGDDTSDVKIVTPLWDVEVEIMRLLQDTEDDVRNRFVWHPVPLGDEWLRPRQVTKFLTLVSERQEMEKIEGCLRKGYVMPSVVLRSVKDLS